jgi:hypothetical protein
VSDNTETVAQHCWSMARRVGLRIAELPVDMREMAFVGAEHCLRAAGSELGIAGPQLDSLIELQMKAIRQIVTDIEEPSTSLRQTVKCSPKLLSDLR